MTLTWSDGRTVEAVLLSQSDRTIRFVIAGANDVTDLCKVDGTWVTAGGEPVKIEFAWQRKGRMPAVSEADCCCSHELAARLTQLLFNGGSDTQDAAPPSVEADEDHHLAPAVRWARGAN